MFRKIFSSNIMQKWQVQGTNTTSGAYADVADRFGVDAGVTESRRLIRLPQVGSCHPHCHHHFWTPPLLSNCPQWQQLTCICEHATSWHLCWLRRSPYRGHIPSPNDSAWFSSGSQLCPHSAPPFHTRGRGSGQLTDVGLPGSELPSAP